MTLYNEKADNYFSSARVEILGLVPEFSARVLEIGCGAGQTLELLKKGNFCSETVGIELFTTAAEEARNKVDRVFCMDVESTPLPEGIGRFDLILLLDVLEHLVNPWMFLGKLVRSHLAPGGVVVVSLPNARHFTLVLPLILGRFDYVERGILDRTHLRFFTKKTAAAMLVEAGLSIDEVKPTCLDFRLKSGKLNALTFGLFSGFLAPQYIFRAVRSECGDLPQSLDATDREWQRLESRHDDRREKGGRWHFRIAGSVGEILRFLRSAIRNSLFCIFITTAHSKMAG